MNERTIQQILTNGTPVQQLSLAREIIAGVANGTLVLESLPFASQLITAAECQWATQLHKLEQSWQKTQSDINDLKEHLGMFPEEK